MACLFLFGGRRTTNEGRKEIEVYSVEKGKRKNKKKQEKKRLSLIQTSVHYGKRKVEKEKQETTSSST